MRLIISVFGQRSFWWYSFMSSATAIMLLLHSNNPRFLLQSKYKQEGKKQLVNSLYSLLPQTSETQHAKELAQLYSEVRNRPRPRNLISVNVWILCDTPPLKWVCSCCDKASLTCRGLKIDFVWKYPHAQLMFRVPVCSCSRVTL